MTDATIDTVAYYDENAEQYAASTGSLDLSSHHDRFLNYIPPAGRILDAGCGAGRDALVFAERGYSVVAFDASLEMVRLARAHVGQHVPVYHQKLEEVAWRGEFDGVWACASLLHVSTVGFSSVASRLVQSLVPRGALYLSFKLGIGERKLGKRLFVDHTERSLRHALATLNVQILDFWTSADVRRPQTEEEWLNAIVVQDVQSNWPCMGGTCRHWAP